MSPTYDGYWRGHEARITTRNNDLGNKVVADLTMLRGPDKGLATVFGLDQNCQTEAAILEVLEVLAKTGTEEDISIGAQTSKYPIINIS